MTLEEALIYAAGYFDGEGCVSVLTHPTKGDHTIRLAVASGDRESLEVFSTWLGGKVRGPAWATQKGKPIYRWYQNNRDAVDTLRKLLPFLIAKRSQALLVIQCGFTPMTRHNSIVDLHAEKSRREALKAALKAAKREQWSCT
jgi:hypothetical protein